MAKNTCKVGDGYKNLDPEQAQHIAQLKNWQYNKIAQDSAQAEREALEAAKPLNVKAQDKADRQSARQKKINLLQGRRAKVNRRDAKLGKPQSADYKNTADYNKALRTWEAKKGVARHTDMMDALGKAGAKVSAPKVKSKKVPLTLAERIKNKDDNLKRRAELKAKKSTVSQKELQEMINAKKESFDFKTDTFKDHKVGSISLSKNWRVQSNVANGKNIWEGLLGSRAKDSRAFIKGGVAHWDKTADLRKFADQKHFDGSRMQKMLKKQLDSDRLSVGDKPFELRGYSGSFDVIMNQFKKSLTREVRQEMSFLAGGKSGKLQKNLFDANDLLKKTIRDGDSGSLRLDLDQALVNLDALAKSAERNVAKMGKHSASKTINFQGKTFNSSGRMVGSDGKVVAPRNAKKSVDKQYYEIDGKKHYVTDLIKRFEDSKSKLTSDENALAAAFREARSSSTSRAQGKAHLDDAERSGLGRNLHK